MGLENSGEPSSGKNIPHCCIPDKEISDRDNVKRIGQGQINLLTTNRTSRNQKESGLSEIPNLKSQISNKGMPLGQVMEMIYLIPILLKERD